MKQNKILENIYLNNDNNGFANILGMFYKLIEFIQFILIPLMVKHDL